MNQSVTTLESFKSMPACPAEPEGAHLFHPVSRDIRKLDTAMLKAQRDAEPFVKECKRTEKINGEEAEVCYSVLESPEIVKQKLIAKCEDAWTRIFKAKKKRTSKRPAPTLLKQENAELKKEIAALRERIAGYELLQ